MSMPLANALNIIRAHQRWRLGFERSKETVPHELTEALNAVLEHFGKRAVARKHGLTHYQKTKTDDKAAGEVEG